MDNLKTQFVNNINKIDPYQWDRLLGDANLFCRHGFLAALENSGAVSAERGWRPMHLLIESNQRIVAVMPAYQKSHSYGEYLFDWSWADAYQANGLRYYPKLLSAIPFTPVTGPRLGLEKGFEARHGVTPVIRALEQACQQAEMSGAQCLFSTQSETDALRDHGWLRRTDVQYHWFNHGYRCFDDFLERFQSRKRKNLLKERRRLSADGIRISRYAGPDITEAVWQAFIQCYQMTYLKRAGHLGYLNAPFFLELAKAMSPNLMMVVAQRETRIIACALYLQDGTALYGRYWGTLEPFPGLHFELCCYQGIEHAIETRLERFEAGAQGEHKLARGFEPVLVSGGCWIEHLDFRRAIADFCQREAQLNRRYLHQAMARLPFRID